jgi:hypothetical protein
VGSGRSSLGGPPARSAVVRIHNIYKIENQISIGTHVRREDKKSSPLLPNRSFPRARSSSVLMAAVIDAMSTPRRPDRG